MTATQSSSLLPSLNSTWYADTGVTNHITHDLNNLTLRTPYQDHDQVLVGRGEGLHIAHIGHSIASASNSLFQLKNILHVPRVTQNLLYVHRFVCDNHCVLIFTPFECIVKDQATGKNLYRGPTDGYLYPINLSLFSQAPPTALLSTKASFSLWHKRLGHPSPQTVQLIISKHSLPLHGSSTSPSVCNECQLGRSSKLSFNKSDCITSSPLQLIHTDIWGHTPSFSISGYRFYIIFVDDFSRFTWFFPLKEKSQAFFTFQQFKTLVENQFDLKIKILRCDNGGEYTNKLFRQFLAVSGIVQQYTCPYTPEQNGMSERKHRHIIELARTLFARSLMQ